MLALKHPLRGDGDIAFDDPSHTYTVRGKKVSVSVTALVSQAVPPEHRFNGRKIIAENLKSWRMNASSKYHAMVVDVPDAQATKNVLASWDKNRDAGTGMHKCFELLLNSDPSTNVNESVNDASIRKQLVDEYATEIAHFHAAMADSSFAGLAPVRTEMSVFGNNAHGDAAVAGQIDLVMKDTEGNYHIVDFKRTAADLTPGAFAFHKTFLDDLPINDHYKYSLQLAMYAVLFELQTGKPIVSTRLLQVHPDLDAARIVPTSDMVEHARALLGGAGVVL